MRCNLNTSVVTGLCCCIKTMPDRKIIKVSQYTQLAFGSHVIYPRCVLLQARNDIRQQAAGLFVTQHIPYVPHHTVEAKKATVHTMVAAIWSVSSLRVEKKAAAHNRQSKLVGRNVMRRGPLVWATTWPPDMGRHGVKWIWAILTCAVETRSYSAGTRF